MHCYQSPTLSSYANAGDRMIFSLGVVTAFIVPPISYTFAPIFLQCHYEYVLTNQGLGFVASGLYEKGEVRVSAALIDSQFSVLVIVIGTHSR